MRICMQSTRVLTLRDTERACACRPRLPLTQQSRQFSSWLPPLQKKLCMALHFEGQDLQDKYAWLTPKHFSGLFKVDDRQAKMNDVRFQNLQRLVLRIIQQNRTSPHDLEPSLPCFSASQPPFWRSREDGLVTLYRSARQREGSPTIFQSCKPYCYVVQHLKLATLSFAILDLLTLLPRPVTGILVLKILVPRTEIRGPKFSVEKWSPRTHFFDFFPRLPCLKVPI